MLTTKSTQMINLQEWDKLVVATYGRPYSFQQQNGCRSRGTFYLTIPDEAEDYDRESIPEELHGSKMGVSFSSWLERDPYAWAGDPSERNYLNLFWLRNFYPEIQTLANDLHAKGLVAAGEFCIDIKW